jgi:uncharacterized protein
VGSIKKKVVGVLSDTHGLLREAVLKKLACCELIIHAGDIGTVTVLDQLERIGKVIAVKGNVDHGSWSARLKESEYINFHGKTILVIHNINDLKIHPHTNSDSKIDLGDEEETTEAYILVRRGDDDEVNEVKSMKANWYQSTNLDVVIYGHSHRASTYYDNGVLYLNPGSAGPRRFTLPTSIAYLRLVDGQIIHETIAIDEN